jgi:hypothetical protein
MRNYVNSQLFTIAPNRLAPGKSLEERPPKISTLNGKTSGPFVPPFQGLGIPEPSTQGNALGYRPSGLQPD